MGQSESTDFPVCPKCGYKERDAWEIDFGAGLDGDAEIWCNDCGHEYLCSRECTVNYRSAELKKSD